MALGNVFMRDTDGNIPVLRSNTIEKYVVSFSTSLVSLTFGLRVVALISLTHGRTK